MAALDSGGWNVGNVVEPRRRQALPPVQDSLLHQIYCQMHKPSASNAMIRVVFSKALRESLGYTRTFSASFFLTGRAVLVSCSGWFVDLMVLHEHT